MASSCVSIDVSDFSSSSISSYLPPFLLATLVLRETFDFYIFKESFALGCFYEPYLDLVDSLVGDLLLSYFEVLVDFLSAAVASFFFNNSSSM